MDVYPKDFIETAEGLIFAVVDSEMEDGHVLCFLRYIRLENSFQKLSTDRANRFLREQFPRFLFYSKSRDANLHGVDSEEIQNIYQPNRRITHLKNCQRCDVIEKKAIELINIFSRNGLKANTMGITGSILIGAQNLKSDIDLVIYGRNNFSLARSLVEQALKDATFENLENGLWADAYKRRGASLSLNEYVWHERRKFNKAAYKGTKFDISLVEKETLPIQQTFRKVKFTLLRALVIDDRYAFDYPARYLLDHSEISEAVSYTPTYAGQAYTGETIEISGFIEESTDGFLRMLVGSTREAKGEYIKVISTKQSPAKASGLE